MRFSSNKREGDCRSLSERKQIFDIQRGKINTLCRLSCLHPFDSILTDSIVTAGVPGASADETLFFFIVVLLVVKQGEYEQCQILIQNKKKVIYFERDN